MDRRSLLAVGLTSVMLSQPTRSRAATRNTGLLMAATPVPSLTPDDVRAIARDAYIYGFPIVDNYRILSSYFVDENGPEYKTPWNTIFNNARVYTPEDTAIQTPNSDTPYSYVGADLRAEPLVFTVPPIEEGRYYSLQFIDLYTFNFAYVGSRTTGNGGGNYLLAGPGWSGETPPGITTVIPCETELAYIFYRTQLFNADDIENVKEIQAGYQVQPLSTFLQEAAPAPVAAVDWFPPLSSEDERTSLDFFSELDFLLQFCPVVPSETEVRARFAELNIGGGQAFDPAALSPEMAQATQDGMADAWADYEALEVRAAAGEVTSGDVFGTREYLQNNYLYRMLGAVDGIYGNSREEAIYPAYYLDADGQPLDGSGNAYTLRFAPGELPPSNAFWSVTMYELPSRALVDNLIDRYLINSPMLPQLQEDADGGITLLIQHDSPGGDLEANWLPAPDGPFIMFMRIYWPAPGALDGTWIAPLLGRVS